MVRNCCKLLTSANLPQQTGEYYELGKLAPGKYKKVMAETRLIQV